jgi:hypothetical protein
MVAVWVVWRFKRCQRIVVDESRRRLAPLGRVTHLGSLDGSLGMALVVAGTICALLANAIRTFSMTNRQPEPTASQLCRIAHRAK